MHIQGWEDVTSYQIANTIGIIIPLSLLITYFMSVNISIDGIYTEGISSCLITYLDVLLKRGYHEYSEINTVFYGDFLERNFYSPYIQVSRLSASETPTMKAFYKMKFENDFYEKLEEILRERCPEAK